jgi:hypothetical protein
MNKAKDYGWRHLIALLAAVACLGAWAGAEARRRHDKSEVATLIENMKNECVGRYLVDVPSQAEVSLSHERVAGFDVDTTAESEASFRNSIRKREEEITARGATNDGSGGMVEARDLRVPGLIGKTFIYGRSRGYLMEGDRRVDLESVSVESHAHLHGLSVKLSAKYADEARAALAEEMLARLRLRGEDEIPDAPGFCVSHAVFVEPLPVRKAEHVTMFVSLPGHPDLALVLFSIAGAKPGPGLIKRIAQTDATTSADELLRVSKLRSDTRSINGLEGEEVVERVREYNFTTGYAFNWETGGVVDDVQRPYLSLEMQTGVSERSGGKPVDTSLHEDALLDLWDSIASTIRLRKNESAPSGPPPEPLGPKLGTVARAGDTCPQSGWWQCDAGSPGLDVHGGRVQFLRKGERMPQALLLPRQSLWQKVKRVQPSIESERSTSWTLVDKRQRPRIAPVVALAQPGIPVVSLDLASDGARIVAIGSYARTGEVCPASGWWRCEELHALDGARWFGRGSVLPAATFQVPSTVFARPGGPQYIQRRSAWQLVRLAEMTVEASVPSAGMPSSGA